MSDQRNILDLAQQTKAFAEKATPPELSEGMHEAASQLARVFGSEAIVYIECIRTQAREWARIEAAGRTNAVSTAAPQLADAVIEMVEALKYCAIEPGYLHAQNNAQHVVARELLTKLGLGTSQTEGE